MKYLFLILFFLISCKNTVIASSPEIICIDPGHGGMDGGAFVDGIKESKLTLEIAFKLKMTLEEAGHIVVMTRYEDTSLPKNSPFIKKDDLEERLRLINNSLLFISLHLNTYSEEKYSGSQVFYANTNPNNKNMAKVMMAVLKEDLENTKREAKELDTIYLLNKAKTTGIILEAGFMTNKSEFFLLQDDKYQLKLASTVTKGVNKYLNTLFEN